jgi:DNA polymerase III alpha subunit
MPDIDIDFTDREKVLAILKHTRASRIESDGKLVKHNTGVYLQEVPVDIKTNLCSIPYNQAELNGYFKIDFLNVGLYKGVRDEDHLISLMNTKPLWDLLEQDEFSNMLFHINGHGDILRTMKPRSVEQLAAVLAMIRPAKRNLIGKSWNEVMDDVWISPSNGDYYFKKSHATAYAIAIVVQMNLICESISYGFN